MHLIHLCSFFPYRVQTRTYQLWFEGILKWRVRNFRQASLWKTTHSEGKLLKATTELYPRQIARDLAQYNYVFEHLKRIGKIVKKELEFFMRFRLKIERNISQSAAVFFSFFN